MAIQYSAAIYRAQLDLVESVPGTGAVLKIRTGAQPASIATADSGTVLCTMTLPTDWMNAASGTTKTILGTWQDASADAAGTAAHFRIYASDGTTAHIQGSVGQGSGDLSLDNTTIASSQQVDVTSFTITANNT
jgi:hypothetical protein